MSYADAAQVTKYFHELVDKQQRMSYADNIVNLVDLAFNGDKQQRMSYADKIRTSLSSLAGKR